jgi:hypothetical protein
MDNKHRLKGGLAFMAPALMHDGLRGLEPA